MREVYAGSVEKVHQELDWQALKLSVGVSTRVIPLNGGSDARRGLAEYWHRQCLAMQVPFERTGCYVKVSGAHYRGRGRRFVQVGRNLSWVHWRKAKRLIALGKASLAS